MGFQPPTIIASNLASVIPTDDLLIFGILMSRMHMAWVRTVAGRLESRYRYSTKVVYNNFPWPTAPIPKVVQAIRDAAQEVLNARALFLARGETLGDIYSSGKMPEDLLKAHRLLDRNVDLAYIPDGWSTKSPGSDLERGSFLLRRLDAILSPSMPLPTPKVKAKGRKPVH